MDAAEYIEQYGEGLTDAEKRYIMAFGAPQFTPGPARKAYTPGLRVADANPVTQSRQPLSFREAQRGQQTP